MRKARFWEAIAGQPLNERQRKVVNRLLDGFEGKLTNAKWAAITKASSDTALRDINDLVRQGILVKDPAGGRSTSYSLAPEVTAEIRLPVGQVDRKSVVSGKSVSVRVALGGCRLI